MSSNESALPSRSKSNAQKPLQRADEAYDLLCAVKSLIIPFIAAADADASTKPTGHGLQQSGGGPRSVLVEHHPPAKLQQLLDFDLPAQGAGRDGLVHAVQKILQYSVNTWDQGFLDKLYAATTPVGLAADLLLSALNTHVHVYDVSPALTVIEKATGRALAEQFGFTGAHAGAVSQPGGSAANLSSIVIARNNLFPETKKAGIGGRKFVLFTSEHGHYSLEKAAQMLGFGSDAVRSIPVDEKGCMRSEALEEAITQAKDAGEDPFYVNATSGTTVLGSFDPLDTIAPICEKHKLWLHVDAAWGGSFIFSTEQRHKLVGVAKADSITLCAHKMLNVPTQCSFLIGKDLRQFQSAMTLPAGYLFHSGENQTSGTTDSEAWDLADLTPQCGRRGDSLKLALTWLYYGTDGFGAYVDHGFESATYLASLVKSNSKFSLVLENPPPCLQVCFYFNKQSDEKTNSKTTEDIRKALIPKGFMIDYAPGKDGKFFRVVVNGKTRKETVEGLIKAIEDVGSD